MPPTAGSISIPAMTDPRPFWVQLGYDSEAAWAAESQCPVCLNDPYREPAACTFQRLHEIHNRPCSTCGATAGQLCDAKGPYACASRHEV